MCTLGMAWRFANYKFVRQGELDNSTLGQTRGEIEFASCGIVNFNLSGDMQGNLKGKRIRFANPNYDPKFVFEHSAELKSTPDEFMEGFAREQRGEVGDILGENYLYIEWYSRENGRCVIELDKADYEIF